MCSLETFKFSVVSVSDVGWRAVGLESLSDLSPLLPVGEHEAHDEFVFFERELRKTLLLWVVL